MQWTTHQIWTRGFVLSCSLILITQVTHYQFLTDVSLNAFTIIKYYRSRFQIEFVIRGTKQYAGLMNSQARNSKVINTHLNLISSMALTSLTIEDASIKKSFEKSVIPMASWKRIKYDEHYMEAIVRKLEIEKDTEKYNQIFDESRNYWAIVVWKCLKDC